MFGLLNLAALKPEIVLGFAVVLVLLILGILVATIWLIRRRRKP